MNDGIMAIQKIATEILKKNGIIVTDYINNGKEIQRIEKETEQTEKGIREELNKALKIIDNIKEAHSPVKAFRFDDYSNYEDTKKAKITMIPELNQPEQSKKEVAP